MLHSCDVASFPHQARTAKEREWQLSQDTQNPNFRLPLIKIVNCYGTTGGSLNPPYTEGTAYYYLQKNVIKFFDAPWFGASHPHTDSQSTVPRPGSVVQRFAGLPGTRLEAVPSDDPREALRGQATVYAAKDFTPWDILAAYTGRAMTEEVCQSSLSLSHANRPPAHSPDCCALRSSQGRAGRCSCSTR